MSGVAAYTKKVKVKTGGSFDDVPVTSASLNHGGDVLDDTEMASNAGFRTRLLGLRDWSVGMSGIWDPTDAQLIILRDAWLARTDLNVQYLPDGTVGNGFEGPVQIESLNITGDVGGIETFDITLQANGALVAAV